MQRMRFNVPKHNQTITASYWHTTPSPPQDSIRVMVTVLRLRANIIKTTVLDCVTQCSQSAAHLYEQFLQVQQIGFVTLDPYAVA